MDIVRAEVASKLSTYNLVICLIYDLIESNLYLMHTKLLVNNYHGNLHTEVGQEIN